MYDADVLIFITPVYGYLGAPDNIGLKSMI